MSTSLIENQLAEARRRLDALHANVQSPRLRRHLQALEQEEATLRTAAREAPDEVDETLGRLESRLAVGEHSVAADGSDDWAAFAAAIQAELRSWDTDIERLQTTAAEDASKARERAEAASASRSRRIAVDEQLAQARDSAGDATHEARTRVTVARDEPELKADELSATLNRKERKT